MKPSTSARQQIQRFEVLGLLGTGAMGAVYKARDPHLGREVAIKVLARPTAEATRMLSLHTTLDLRGAPAGELLAEAQMMARVSHANVLPVYEVGLADREIFVVMEYVAGSDLRTWLARPHSTGEIIDVFAQAARGLAEAHAHGVVHGDFKPENVLVTHDGRVRVADFGLSRLNSPTLAAMRVDRDICGTPYYMAPELWKGEGPSIPADVFALCTALAEALGAEPADRPRLDSALRARGASRRLRAVIATGLAEDGQARPTVNEVLASLTARPGIASRWRLAVGAGAAVAGAAAAALIVFLPEQRGGVCDAEAHRFAGSWSRQQRAALEAKGIAARFDEEREDLSDVLRTVCAAERRGELSQDQVLRRMSCLERRTIEMDAMAARIISEHMPAEKADKVARELPSDRDCLQVEAPPLRADRGAVVALYRRLVATYAGDVASPERSGELAAVEADARALGERELEGRAAVLLGMRQLESDQLVAADASFVRGYDVAIAINATDIALVALIERGINAEKLGDAKAAHTYAKLAFQIADKPTVSESWRIHVRYALARSLVAVGQPGEAIERVDQALALGPEDPWTQEVLRQVKFIALGQLGQHEHALAIAREALEISRKSDGERHSDYGIALNVVAAGLFDIGDRAGALGYRQRALAVMAAALPADHSMVIFQRMLVAGDLAINGRFDEALAEGKAVLEIVDLNESVRAERPGMAMRLGLIMFRSGHFDDGLRLFEEGLDGSISESGQDHPYVLSGRLERIGFEMELGRWDDAERHMDKLEQSYRARDDQALPLALLDGVYRAQLALARKDPRSAEARARAALAALDELHGSAHDREDLLRILGASLVDQGRWQEALDALAAATTIAEARYRHMDRLALIDIERARALAGSGRRAEAQALARAARAVLRKFPGYLRARTAADMLLNRKPR